MANDLALRTENIIAPIRGELAALTTDSALQRLEATVRIAFSQNPDLLKCSPESLQRELTKCAADVLVPDGKEAFINVYFNSDSNTHEAAYQPMIYGILKRLKELGGVESLNIEFVRDKDEFHVENADGEVRMTHRYSPFGGDRGEIVGVYCEFRDVNGKLMHREMMPKSELDKVKATSARQMKGKTSPAWATWEEEMFKKAVVRRASKWVVLQDERLRSLMDRFDEMFDFRAERPQPGRKNPFAGIDQKRVEAAPQADDGAVEDVHVSEEDSAHMLKSPEEWATEYSDALWAADNPDALSKAMHAFRSESMAGVSLSGDMDRMLKSVEDIHADRCGGGSDADAIMKLAEINIDSPDPYDD